MFHNSNSECVDNKDTRSDHPSQKDTVSHAALIKSSTLFAGMNQILISHAGEVYKLRITKNGKLILNK